jgi:hypothetical protein
VSAEGIGSVTLGVRGYIARGDEGAARRLSERFFARMVGPARAQPRRIHRPGAHKGRNERGEVADGLVCARGAEAGRLKLIRRRWSAGILP